MVDSAILATKIAAVRDAVARIRELLPATVDAFRADRTAREVVTLNLYVAVQETIALATHWIAAEGLEVPRTYGEMFLVLADHGVLDRELADRLRAAAGLRNLIAHQYGIVDAGRIFTIASTALDDLLSFCHLLASRATS